jgi:hypothetical protein
MKTEKIYKIILGDFIGEYNDNKDELIIFNNQKIKLRLFDKVSYYDYAELIFYNFVDNNS